MDANPKSKAVWIYLALLGPTMSVWGWFIGWGIDPFDHTYWLTMTVAVAILCCVVAKSGHHAARPEDAKE
jgi:hypothetical protein